MRGFGIYLRKSVDTTPTDAMRRAAERGLESRRKAPKSKKGGLTPGQASKQGIGSGVARASQIKSGKKLSPSTVRRMHSFFSRHSAYKHKHKSDPQGKAKQSWDQWGGNAGQAWAARKVKELDREKQRKKVTKGFGIFVKESQ